MTGRLEWTDFVRVVDAAWTAPDPSDAVATHFAEDGALHDMTAAEPVVGRAAISAAVRAFTAAFAPLTFHSRVVVSDDTTATVEWTAHGVHVGELDGIAPTGKPIEIRGINLFRRNDAGELTEERSYWDSGTLLRQLGVFDAV